MTDFRADAAATADWVARYLEGVRELPVLAQVEPGQIRGALPAAPPESAEPFADVLRDLDEVLLPGITHWNHPRFFAYFAVSGSEPGILAEFLTAALNVNAMLWRTSPAATELEELAVDWVRQLLGLSEGLHGHIEDTASTSTLAALTAARHLRPEGTVICSEHAHSSMDKAARLLGVPIRKVPSDDEFRMRPDALAEALGEVEVSAVVATSGRLDQLGRPGARDPPRSAPSGRWLHVDAAYSGPAMVCEENRWDSPESTRPSVVVNPHKWLLTPIDCSCSTRAAGGAARGVHIARCICARARRASRTSPTTAPPRRRFRSLKLWRSSAATAARACRP